MAAGERRRRLEGIRAHVREHDLAAWVAAQLADSTGRDRPRSRRTIRPMATTAAPELVSVNPATLEPVGAVRRTDPDELPRVVAAARAAQEQWRAAGPSARARGTARSRHELVRVHADEIADSIVAETAKPRTEAIANELFTAVDHALWLAKHAPRVLADERVRFSQLHLKTKKAWLLYEPLGVVAAITPWNIPFAIPFSVKSRRRSPPERRRPQAVGADAAHG